MPILKKREIDNLEQMSGEELEAFLEEIAGRSIRYRRFVRFSADETGTRRVQSQSALFDAVYNGKPLDFPKLTSWLQQNGGYCDCKVIEQIMPIWRKTFDNFEGE